MPGNPAGGKKRVVILGGGRLRANQSPAVGMPVISMIFGKESGCQGEPWHLSKGEKMAQSLRDKLDSVVWNYVKDNCPEKLEPMEWYREGGIHDTLMKLLEVTE